MNLSDREILARTIQAEAGNQGKVGMLGVGAVIMNRLRSGLYPNSIKDVILQKSQFSPWNAYTKSKDTSQAQDMLNLTPSDAAYQTADRLMNGVYADPTKGALNFYNPDFSNPAWGQARAGGDWFRIGDHLFGTAQPKSEGTDTMALPNTPTPSVPNEPLLTPQATTQPKTPGGLFDVIGGAVGGKFSKFKDAITGDDPDASDKLAIALMSLSGNPQQLAPLMQLAAADIQERKALRAQNKSIDYLEGIDPNLAAMARANPSMVGNILSAVASKQLNPKNATRVVGADVVKELFPGQEIQDGLYEIEEKDGNLVGAKKIGGGGPNIEINTQEENYDVLREDMKEYLAIGRSSRTTIAQAELLGELLEQTGTGLGAGLKQFAYDTLGIDVRDDAAAAAQAIISQLVPAQREEGSGPMSDADLNMYKLSIPQIAAKPGGNKIIIDSMISIARYNKEVGDLAKDQLLGKITYDEFYEEMAKLDDPLADVKAFIKSNNIGPMSSDTGMTEEEATKILLGNEEDSQ